MAWDEAQYIVDEILNGVEYTQITGIPPRNMEIFSAVPGNQKVKIKCKPPEDTVVDGKLLCTVAGVRVIRKAGSAPTGPFDGTTVLDVKRGQLIEVDDAGLISDVEYFYGFFPYSDHGVYNFNEANIISATPKTIRYWAFDQTFSNLDPATTITYPTGFVNSNYARMWTNEGTGPVTAGDWLSFLQDVLKNYPFMVDKQGRAVYQLDPNDYTKKMDGSNSDYNNTSFEGGAFAWLNKIWMREEYSSDGGSREVQFANGPADGFYAVGFHDFDDVEMDGIWLPMGYMDGGGRTLVAGTTPYASQVLYAIDSLITGFSSRAAFLGGPIINVLRDLEYMMFKHTDIQKAAGYGRCDAGNQAVIANAVVPNGIVPGFYGTTNDMSTMNKYFHSQVLGSYQLYCRDPYTLLVDGRLKVQDHYIYDITGESYIDTGITWDTKSIAYPSHLVKSDNKFGSDPKCENTATSSTGLCDFISATANGTRVGLRFGCTYSGIMSGPAMIDLSEDANAIFWAYGNGVIVLPPADYTPEIQ